MSTKTSNLGLTKPALSDAADITAYNSNWDILDTQVSNIKNKVDNLSTDVEDLNGTLPISKGGTGATTASQARTNLGAAPSNHTHNYAGSSTAGGSATSAEKLATSRNIRTDLSKTSTVKFDGTEDVTPGVTGTLPIGNGGTGATTASQALTNLGAAPVKHSHTESDLPVMSISKGGTGATTATKARENLGVPSSTEFSTLNTNTTNHINNKSNPHGVTAEQIGLVQLSEIGNLHSWDKYNGTSVSNVPVGIKYVTTTKYSFIYCDTLTIDKGVPKLTRQQQLSIDDYSGNNTSVLLGKFIWYNSKVYYIPKTSSFSHGGTSEEYHTLVKVSTAILIDTYDGCTTSKDNSTYPTNGVHTDNCWYLYRGKLGETQCLYGTNDLTAGESPLATGKLYFVYE